MYLIYLENLAFNLRFLLCICSISIFPHLIFSIDSQHHVSAVSKRFFFLQDGKSKTKAEKRISVFLSPWRFSSLYNFFWRSPKSCFHKLFFISTQDLRFCERLSFQKYRKTIQTKYIAREAYTIHKIWSTSILFLWRHQVYQLLSYVNQIQFA